MKVVKVVKVIEEAVVCLSEAGDGGIWIVFKSEYEEGKRSELWEEEGEYINEG